MKASGSRLAATALVALACTGCDRGTQVNQAVVTGSPVHVVGGNILSSQALIANGRIELEFDSYLLPACITRQTFELHDLNMNYLDPTVAYDPVARIVTMTPMAPLEAGQTYVVQITTPSSPADPNGLRAIDGATIDPTQATIEFPVVDTGMGTPQAPLPTVDFCTDVLPLLTGCAGASCHGGTPPGPAEGLRLDTPTWIQTTAVGRVSQESNTGAIAGPEPPGLHFGVDMPLIDPGDGTGSGGNPGNSWLLYKLLLAVPTPAGTSGAAAAGCDGGTTTPTDVSGLHLVAWQPSSSDLASTWVGRNTSLSEYVLGREMPYPADPSAPLSQNTAALTIDQLELISRWIAQPTNTGVPLVPATCSCSQ